MFVLTSALLIALAVFQAAGSQQVQQTPGQEIKGRSPHTQIEVSALQRQAEAGDVIAQLALATAYLDGNGVSRNDHKAFQWFERAADQGNAVAENEVGTMYRAGQGVERSKEEAVKWYRKAALQKNDRAMFNLGTAYYNGDGIPLDDVSAYAWFLAAQDAGSEAGREAASRSESELKDFQKVDTYIALAGMYQAGADFPKDFGAAAKWYRKAADAGSLPARVQLASMMVLGQGVPQNFSQAREDCEEAAKHQYSPGDFCMGLLYQRGLGVRLDLGEAAKWFNRATDLGHTTAMYFLGQMYWKGEGVRADKTRAYMLIGLAAGAGIAGAQQDQELLAQQMEEGQIKSAQKKAAEWVKQHPPLGLRKNGKLIPSN